MNQHIEIEFKNLLNEIEFNQLMDHFQIAPSTFHTQQNHYFDTANFSLKSQNSALRIREKNGQHELTLKQPASEGLLETNQTISMEMAHAFLKEGTFPKGPVRDLIMESDLHPEDFTCFGTLKTDRSEFPFQGGLLVLDHSSYMGQEDYELEYEVTHLEDGQKKFLKLLESLQIPVRETENKVKRFYRAKFSE
ncbi:CYTH domain-containing protein [Peribacillus sp. NPDC097675]|uniref:CYTH domain-containing protein n=1 Tax=Peribacillus sp. NPDC097675 TaxID=3390618 RepID=UPI003D04C9A1